MNEKITFPRLASLLADRSGRSKRFSEDFLREFFALISERLEAGESIKVKGLGTFRLSRVEPRRSVDVTTGQPMEISGHSKVVFVPARELAEAVNSPFEAFTSIEISDDADISQLFSEDEITLKDETDEIAEEATSIKSEESNATTYTAETSENNSDNFKAEIPETQSGSEEGLQSDLTEVEKEAIPTETEETRSTDTEATFSTNNEEAIESQEEEIYEEEYEHKRSWLKILMISFGAAMIAIIAILALWYVFANDNFNMIFEKPLSYIYAHTAAKVNDAPATKESTCTVPDSTKAIEAAASDSLSPLEKESEVPTAPSDAVVYDTIGTTRYLTTMAKSHYGNYNLWPYIYEENKAKLGHPDRIRPGTPVVIPKLSKYGVDPTNEQHIENAKKLGVEIYARYGKKIQ